MLTSNGYTLDTAPERLGRLEPVPMDERTDRDALWQRLRRDGYLCLTGHLDPAEVRDFRQYYFESLHHTGLTSEREPLSEGIDSGVDLDRGAMRATLFDEIVPSTQFASLTAHPQIRDWFAWLLDDTVHLHKRKIIRHVRPGEKGIGTATQAHYDLVYLREGTDRVLSMWIPLGDCPVEMGGLTYLEGSHVKVLRDEATGRLQLPARSITADLPSLADELDSRWLVADYKAGDVMVHSAHLIHAGTDNVDAQSRIRLSTDIRYQRESDPIDWRWQDHWNDEDGL